MNLSIHIFKRYNTTSGRKVASYPTDLVSFAQNAINNIELKGNMASKLVVLRRDKLVYYIYAIVIESKIFGFVFVMNDAYLTEVKPLIDYCTDMIAVMCSKRLIITWSEANGLQFVPKSKWENDSEAEVLARLENLRDSAVFQKTISLPPLDYSAEKQRVELVYSGENVGQIPEKYQCLEWLDISLPQEKYSVTDLLREKEKTVESWKNKYSSLSDKYDKLNRQKKRTRWVVFLLLCLIAGGVATFFISKRLGDTKSNLQDASTCIDNCVNDIEVLKREYLAVTDKLSKYEKQMPILVDSVRMGYEKGGSRYKGLPAPGEALYLRFNVYYKSNCYIPIDVDQYPTRIWRPDEEEPASEAIEEEESQNINDDEPSDVKRFTMDLRCYYKENGKYVLKQTKTSYWTDIEENGSFYMKFDMGYSRMPAGSYRIELWDADNHICVAYKEFTI